MQESRRKRNKIILDIPKEDNTEETRIKLNQSSYCTVFTTSQSCDTIHYNSSTTVEGTQKPLIRQG